MRLAIAQKDEQDQTTFMDLIDGNSELLNTPLLWLWDQTTFMDLLRYEPSPKPPHTRHTVRHPATPPRTGNGRGHRWGMDAFQRRDWLHFATAWCGRPKV